MKYKLLPFIFIVFLFAQSPDSRGYLVQVGDPSPDWSLSFPDGSTTSLHELDGKVILLQFTASWCSVCRREMPHIEKEIWLPLKEKGLIVIGVDRDEPKEIVEKFAKEMGITYPLALDPNAEIFAKFAVKESGVTRNVVIDQNGYIAFLTRLFEIDEFQRMKTTLIELIQND